MRTVHKFDFFGAGGSQVIMNMPIGAKLLTVQMQDGVPRVWAEVDTEADLEPRKIAVFGTGWSMSEESGKYIATVQDGEFVWHFYDRTGLA